MSAFHTELDAAGKVIRVTEVGTGRVVLCRDVGGVYREDAAGGPPRSADALRAALRADAMPHGQIRSCAELRSRLGMPPVLRPTTAALLRAGKSPGPEAELRFDASEPAPCAPLLGMPRRLMR